MINSEVLCDPHKPSRHKRFVKKIRHTAIHTMYNQSIDNSTTMQIPVRAEI